MSKHLYKVFGASPFGDISFIVKHTHLRGSIMLDCGNISYFNNSQVGDITHLLISHTHMDHFYGFDRIIRSMLISPKKLIIFGPKGIIDNVFHRTQSYTWNLVDGYEFALEVHELGEEGVTKSALLPANKGFQPQQIKCDHTVTTPNQQTTTIALNSGFTAKYEIFDHGIPSVGYRIDSPQRVNISEENMKKLGLQGGAWVRQLKEAYLEGTPEAMIRPDLSTTTSVPEQVSAKSLFHLLKESQSETVTFATDIAPTATNIAKAVSLAQESNILMIEGVFMDEDKDQADLKKHLTIDISKTIFKDSNSDSLYLFHHSPRYEVFKGKLNGYIRKGIEEQIFPLSSRESY